MIDPTRPRSSPTAWAMMVVLGLALAGQAQGGAWTRSAGGLYAEVELSGLRSEHERDHRGQRLPIFLSRLNFVDADYLESTLRVYAEYGWTPQLTIVGKVNGKYAESNHTVLGGAYFDRFRARARTLGFGDLHTGARWGVVADPAVIAIEGQVKLPLGYPAQPLDGGPPLGNAEVDADLRGLVGRSFGAVYANGMGGYRWRGGVYNDELIYELELGAKSTVWLGQLRLEGVRNTVEPQDLAGTPVQLPLPGGGGTYQVIVGDQDWTKLRGSIARRWGAVWLRASVVELLAGKNTIDGTEVSLGLVIER